VKFSLSKAALAALAVEALIIGALFVIVAKEPAKPQPRPVVMLSFPTPEAPKPKAPPVKEKPVPRPKPVHHETPRHKPTQPKQVAHTPQPRIAATTPVAQAAVPLPPATPAPPVPQRPAPAPTVSDTFRDAVRAAVQAVVHTPYAAKMAHITGRAQVSFSYRDSTVSSPKITVSSGFNMLDKAAIEAVNAAGYPPPPPALAGKSLQFMVWVRFYQSDTDLE
jgi:protein TonB